MNPIDKDATLVIGDPHAKTEELEDCRALVDGVCQLRSQYSTIATLGDLFDTHAVLSLAVVEFWRSTVARWRQLGFRQVHVRGNHDMAANGTGANALDVFRELLGPDDMIVSDQYVVHDINFIAHQVNEWDFRKRLRPARLTVCHQTFQGAQYENGFYASDGFDQNEVPSDLIISGHVHRRAQLGKVRYEGSPRWRTKSDANELKYVVGYPNGLGRDFVLHATSDWCRPIENLEDVEGRPYQSRWPQSKLTVTVKGRPEFVKARAAHLESQGVSVHRRPDLLASLKVSESRPIGESMTAFMSAYQGTHGTPGARLAELAAKRFA